MDEHIFVSNINIRKAHDGSWFITKLFTSAGNFDLGQELSAVLDKNKLEAVIDDVKLKIVPQIQEFIKNEVLSEQKRKQGEK